MNEHINDMVSVLYIILDNLGDLLFQSCFFGTKTWWFSFSIANLSLRIDLKVIDDGFSIIK